MKTKVTQFLFATVLLFSLNAIADIGGPTLPPKPPTGPPFKEADSEHYVSKNLENFVREYKNQ